MEPYDDPDALIKKRNTAKRPCMEVEVMDQDINLSVNADMGDEVSKGGDILYSPFLALEPTPKLRGLVVPRALSQGLGSSLYHSINPS